MERLKLIVFIYSISNIVIGLGVTATAIWLHAAPDIYAYMVVFVRSATDTTLTSAAGLLLATGIILTIASILGLIATIKQNRFLLTIYLWLQPLVFVLGITAGFLAVALYWNIHVSVKGGMQDQLNTYYAPNTKIGKAWNRVQVKKRCCGADGTWDYANTKWYQQNNPIDEDPTMLVPSSCCYLAFNQDSTLYWVDPEQLTVKDPLRCQQDAHGNIGNSANVHIRGCYVSLFYSNPDLRDYWRNIYLDVSIFTIISVIEGLGLGAGFLQLVGIVLTWIYKSSFQQSNQLNNKR